MNISNQFITHYINGILFCALNILAHVPQYNMKVVDGKTTSSIKSYTASRIIPLEKKPDGVRPIGIGEVLRRIIGKAVLSENSRQEVVYGSELAGI